MEDLTLETHLFGCVFFGGLGDRPLFSDLSGVILFHRMRPAAEFRCQKRMDDGAKEDQARNEIEGLFGHPLRQHLPETGARIALTLTLFFIGAGLDRAAVRTVGARPFIHGLLLWLVVGSGTLAAIMAGWIR